MSFESLTDVKINELLIMPKRIINPNSKEKPKEGHTQQNFKIIGINEPYNFNLYLRQNTMIPEDFSCGLCWYMQSGEIITLIRYNGNNHPHRNHIENERIEFKCHIHKACEKYILSKKKPDGYAVPTDKYSTLQGALHCIVTDCFIKGLNTQPETLELFHGNQSEPIKDQAL